MLKLGAQNMSALYLGGQEIKRAYMGDALVFDSVPSVPVYTITAAIEPSGAGTVTGAGQYKEGESVTIKAVPGEGYKFTGWRENGAVVSTSEAYTFTVTRDMEFTAVFEAEITRLPAGYQEVEYISNPNLGYIYSSNSDWMEKLLFKDTRLEISMRLPSPSATGLILGNNWLAYSGTSLVNYARNMLQYNSSTNNIALTSARNGYNIQAQSGIMNIVIDVPKGLFSVNQASSTISTSPSTATQCANPSLFAASQVTTGTGASTNYGSSPINYYLYSLKLYTSTASTTGDLTHDYVPCINPSGLVGIYDVVTKTFWSSSVSSKPFVAGPAV